MLVGYFYLVLIWFLCLFFARLNSPAMLISRLSGRGPHPNTAPFASFVANNPVMETVAQNAPNDDEDSGPVDGAVYISPRDYASWLPPAALAGNATVSFFFRALPTTMKLGQGLANVCLAVRLVPCSADLPGTHALSASKSGCQPSQGAALTRLLQARENSLPQLPVFWCATTAHVVPSTAAHLHARSAFYPALHSLWITNAGDVLGNPVAPRPVARTIAPVSAVSSWRQPPPTRVTASAMVAVVPLVATTAKHPSPPSARHVWISTTPVLSLGGDMGWPWAACLAACLAVVCLWQWGKLKLPTSCMPCCDRGRRDTLPSHSYALLNEHGLESRASTQDGHDEQQPQSRQHAHQAPGPGAISFSSSSSSSSSPMSTQTLDKLAAVQSCILVGDTSHGVSSASHHVHFAPTSGAAAAHQAPPSLQLAVTILMDDSQDSDHGSGSMVDNSTGDDTDAYRTPGAPGGPGGPGGPSSGPGHPNALLHRFLVTSKFQRLQSDMAPDNDSMSCTVPYAATV